MKKELAESSKSFESAIEANLALTNQLKELSDVHAHCEAEEESLKDEIVGLTAERLSFQDEIQKLKGGLTDLSVAKHADVEMINQLEHKINKLEKDLAEAENFVVDQHRLGFSKALQQAKYFYKIPLDEGNFDVGKDFYNGELIPVNDIPYDKA